MNSLLLAVLAVVVLLMAIGFGLGWYVRGAYVRRYMKKHLARKARRQREVEAHEAAKHNLSKILEERARDPDRLIMDHVVQDPGFMELSEMDAEIRQQSICCQSLKKDP
ncbi:MAG: hypothetical protein WC683_01080 [bacterium]